MKRNILTIALASLFLLASCGKEEGGSVAESDPMFGNITDPAWVVDTHYDYSSSMTAVVTVDLQGGDSLWTVGTADRLAAFAGDECIGLAAPNDAGLFFLFIVPAQQSDGYSPVTLRYFSSYYRNIFLTGTTFPFVGGSQQGTAANPLPVQFRAALSSQQTAAGTGCDVTLN